MNFFKIPARLEPENFMSLRDILAKFPSNTLQWRILDLTGVGKAPDGTTMPAFESTVESSPDGYRLSWPELLSFSADMEQVWDCLIVGSQSQAVIQRSLIEAGEFFGCEYVIEVFDSTEWRIGAVSLKSFAALQASFRRDEDVKAPLRS